ncbi:DUF992 domain-containing protein [Methylobacterium durans]|uniref:DUF992 domain-containing protein n=1 Tax=Methylobacterium durans TaxID=2202825 RepID=UPI002AFED1CE|nr:DUF992 domain-containing protein [Methylobacterium durans]MEA1832347.1 DUF992 domain-containing protein [Methylobacterium durans]
MRTLTIAFTAAVLAAGAAYARGSITEAPNQQAAGTLTCTTKPDASLIFGRTPIAACTFVSDRGSFRQSYLAMFTRVGRGESVERAQTVKWRVMTRDGFARPGMLVGLFTAPGNEAHASEARQVPELAGRTARLRLLSHSGQTAANFALVHPRIDFAATETSMTR